MDEPTTHLDMPSIDALIAALQQFTGTLIFISHDVYFIRALANHVVHINAGRLTHYPGGYEYYLDKTKAQSARAALTATGRDAAPAAGAARQAGLTASRKEQTRHEAQKRQARSRQRKEQQQIVHGLEKAIHELEQRQAELTAELENPETYQQPGLAPRINRELATVHRDLAKLSSEWESAATTLAALETA
jgi:ATP-binding cassette subfamily F protein 3